MDCKFLENGLPSLPQKRQREIKQPQEKTRPLRFRNQFHLLVWFLGRSKGSSVNKSYNLAVRIPWRNHSGEWTVSKVTSPAWIWGFTKGPLKCYPLEMVVKNCSLKVTHATQFPRNLSKQFQDCSQFGHRLLIVSLPWAEGRLAYCRRASECPGSASVTTLKNLLDEEEGRRGDKSKVRKLS